MVTTNARFERNIVGRCLVIPAHHVTYLIEDTLIAQGTQFPSYIRYTPRIVDVILDWQRIAARASVDDEVWGRPHTLLLIPHLLKQIDQLTLSKIEFFVKERNPETLGGQDEGVGEAGAEGVKEEM